MATLLKLIKIIIDDRCGRDIAILTDLPNGRWVLVLALIFLDKFQDFLVAFA
jgi:hypothetical protein